MTFYKSKMSRRNGKQVLYEIMNAQINFEGFLHNKSQATGSKRIRGRPVKEKASHALDSSDGSGISEPANKGGRPPKNLIYKTERLEILNKLNAILGITDTNSFFCLSDLNKDQTKIDQIMKLKPDVEKYFTAKALAVFAKENAVKPYAALIKIIYRGNGFELNPKPVSYIVVKKENGINDY